MFYYQGSSRVQGITDAREERGSTWLETLYNKFEHGNAGHDEDNKEN